MQFPQIPTVIVLLLSCLFLSGCEYAEGRIEEPHNESAAHNGHSEGQTGHHEHAHKIVVTSPVVQDVVSTQQYVCQIHSRRHIEVCALEGGYLEKIAVKEGQTVKQGELMFKVLPVLLQAKLDADKAEAQLAEIELKLSTKLYDDNVVSDQDVALAKARLAKAQAKVQLAQAELDFTDVKAPFDGIVDRQMCQQGSLIEEGDVLTTLSDNGVMWAYFNVPEARYLEYKAELDQADGVEERLQIELLLANGETFPQAGKIGAIEADFNNETGNIAFRADFSNPDSLLRHGQTGTVLIHRELKDAIVIPQRATYEILSKQYVYVIEESHDDDKSTDAEHDDDDHDDGERHHAKHGVVRQREIVVQKELEDIYVIKDGVGKNDRIIFEGIRTVRDGEETEYEYLKPEEAFSQLKHHAE